MRFIALFTCVRRRLWSSFFAPQLAPRAQIFRRDAGKVNDTASMLALMRCE